MNTQGLRNTGKVKMSIKNSTKLEKYSLWIRINREIEGPILKIGIFFIILFLIVTLIILFLKIEMITLQKIFYYSCSGIFLIAVWLVFCGLILRSEK